MGKCEGLVGVTRGNDQLVVWLIFYVSFGHLFVSLV